MNIPTVPQPDHWPMHKNWDDALFGLSASRDDGRRFHDGSDWDERQSYETSGVESNDD